jgi:hypothetical protein
MVPLAVDQTVGPAHIQCVHSMCGSEKHAVTGESVSRHIYRQLTTVKFPVFVEAFSLLNKSEVRFKKKFCGKRTPSQKCSRYLFYFIILFIF